MCYYESHLYNNYVLGNRCESGVNPRPNPPVRRRCSKATGRHRGVGDVPRAGRYCSARIFRAPRLRAVASVRVGPPERLTAGGYYAKDVRRCRMRIARSDRRCETDVLKAKAPISAVPVSRTAVDEGDVSKRVKRDAGGDGGGGGGGGGETPRNPSKCALLLEVAAVDGD